jgi:hypothetical protein
MLTDAVIFEITRYDHGNKTLYDVKNRWYTTLNACGISEKELYDKMQEIQNVINNIVKRACVFKIA